MTKCICKNCGKELILDEPAACWLHKWDRWKGDNGFWCTKEKKTYGEALQGTTQTSPE